MATQIIAAIRRYTPRLRGNTFLIATELAHRMNAQGMGRVAYHYLAWKAHCSTRTAIRQIATLLDLGLIKKIVIRTKAGFAWNLYHYIGPRVHTASPPGKTRCDRVSQTLPEAEREKEHAVREEWERQKKGLRFWTPGTEQWAKTCEEITRLEGLLASGADRTAASAPSTGVWPLEASSSP